MKHILPVLAIGSLSLSLLSCKKAATTPPAPAAAPTAAVPGAPSTPGAARPPAAVKPMPAEIPSVVARINGEAIERWEFDNAVKRVEQRAGSAVPPEKRDEILRGVLDQLVAYHLLAQESRARKIAVVDSDVEARLADIKKSFPTEDAFTQGIAAQGLTPEHLRAQARTSLEVAKVIDAEINSKIAVQDADVSTFYQQNLDRFKQGESVHASHILFSVPQDAPPPQKTEAKTRAQSALKQIKGGADFAEIARTQSQDQASAPNGGDLGFFPKGQMNPQFEDAAFKLKAGGISPVVETPFGFHIIKVHEKRGPRTAPLPEVAGQIKDFLMQGQREQKLEQFVEQVKGKAKIEILV